MVERLHDGFLQRQDSDSPVPVWPEAQVTTNRMEKKGKNPKSSSEIPSWRRGTASHNRVKAFKSSITP